LHSHFHPSPSLLTTLLPIWTFPISSLFFIPSLLCTTLHFPSYHFTTLLDALQPVQYIKQQRTHVENWSIYYFICYWFMDTYHYSWLASGVSVNSTVNNCVIFSSLVPCNFFFLLRWNNNEMAERRYKWNSTSNKSTTVNAVICRRPSYNI
jgi:hypothetical protein